ncbi:MAG: argininosuccinate lyase [Candidatus Taylorbacteria bacterium CG11_big_fil_rev_8_21_14_0_20_46_11]|uniref:Argininosuccinate lyase n=1 Tax=Candidatus Taylorbacteria bacterium CG11_big_fil_rev_8_21_14_0_20_46_11 TaxID=1975025 RepID=A0A2H0KBM3_9BACT|nr:MAG: argininosuccinate lyase [Candidatus Taylorbacteria bacterium CG11_big_fil_rev_8_21_14_0_20_46_11]
MTKLWNKTNHSMHPDIEKYTSGSDYLFDNELLPFDVVASKAHVKGLQNMGILTAEELKDILGGFDALLVDYKKGNIVITPEDEDCHTVLENYLVKKLGAPGKKIHAGRSRNDQVLVALRLYMKEHLKALQEECALLAISFLSGALKYKGVPMPGYSHTQQAMLGSVGHYYSAYAESLIDDADFLGLILKHIDTNPLGSAAGFGTALPIDREYTTKELGFAGIQQNTLYCQNSRGKFESLFLEGVVQVMLTLGRFANDLILFTSQEFSFFSVDRSLTTGSSIMPQKRNLDAMELLRGNVSVVASNQLMIKDISKNLLSGYNRDLQLIKKPLMESVAIVHNSIEIVGLFLKGITPNVEKIKATITPGIFAADIANHLVKKGTPFRDAYKQALDLLADTPIDMQKNLASKKTLGAPGNLQIEVLRKRMREPL